MTMLHARSVAEAGAAVPLVAAGMTTGYGASKRPGLWSTLALTLTEWKLLLEDSLAEQNSPEVEQFVPAYTLAGQSIFVEQTLRLYAEDKKTSDVIVFGSWANGSPDDLSDLDVIVVSNRRSQQFEHRRIQIGQSTVDVTTGGLPALVAQLTRPSSDNNNWFLNACVEGKPWPALQTRGQILLRTAMKICRRGPQAPSYDQLRRVSTVIDAQCKVIATTFERSKSSDGQALSCRMRCDQFAIYLLYMRYYMDRKWTTSLNTLLVRCAVDYPAVSAAFDAYAKAQDSISSVECVHRLAGLVTPDLHQKLEKGEQDDCTPTAVH